MSGIIRVAILGDARSLEAAAGESVFALGKIDKKGATTGAKMMGMAKKITMAAATVAIAVTAISIKNGDALNESTDQLKNAMKKQGESVKGLQATTNPYLKKLENWGFTNTEVNDSLTQMTHSGIKLNVALKDQSVVADIARAKHTSLAAAALMVTKASQGNSRALKQLGIDTAIANGSAKSQQTAFVAVAKAGDKLKLVEEKIHDGRLKGVAASDAAKAAFINLTDAQKKLTDAQHGGGDVVALLSKKMGGTAATAAKSLHGQMSVLHAKFTDITAHIGQKLIPILMKVVGWFSKNTWAIGVLAGIIGGALLAATIAWTVSLFTATGALAFLISPITLVVLAIAAIIAVIVEVWTHWDQIWKWISNNPAYAIIISILSGGLIPIILLVVAAVKWVAANWSLIWATITSVTHQVLMFIGGLVMGFVNTIISVVNGVGRVASIIWGAFMSAYNAVRGVVDLIVGVVGGIVDRAASVLGGITHAIVAPFSAAFDGIKSAWNSTIGSLHFKIPGWVPVIGGDSFDGPRLHGGGIFNSGRGEGLALLKDDEGVFTPAQMKAMGLRAMMNAGAGGSGGNTIMNFPSGASPAAVSLARKQWLKRNGKSGD